MFKRLLSLVLTFLLVLSLAPIGAIAADVPATEEPTVPATEEPTVPATEEPTVPATEEPTVPATEEPTVPATEEPTVPATEEPTMPATVEPTVPATESPSQKESVIRSAGRPERNAAPVTGTVEFSMSVSGVDSNTLPSVSLLLTHEDGVTTHTVTLTNDYGSGWDAYSLPVGNYTVSLSGLSLDGYELDLYLPTSLQVTEEDDNYYDFSITAYKRNGTVSVKVSFAESSDLQAEDFPNGISLSIADNLISTQSFTLDNTNNWSYSTHTLPTPCSANILLKLSNTSGYLLTVTNKSSSTNCTPDFEASHDHHDAASIESCVYFEDGGSYATELELDFRKYDTGDVEFALNVTSDKPLPADQPLDVSITLWDESNIKSYSGTFQDGKLSFSSLPVGRYRLEFYWPEVEDFTSEASYPEEFAVTTNPTVLDVHLSYTAVKHGSVTVNVSILSDRPLPDDFKPSGESSAHPSLNFANDSYSLWEDLDSEIVTSENIPVGTYQLQLYSYEADGYTVDVAMPDEVTVEEGETAQVNITITYTAIKYGSAKVQLIRTGDPLPEDQPYIADGLLHIGDLGGASMEAAYDLHFTPENNWTVTLDKIPVGEYTLSPQGFDAESFVLLGVTQSCNTLTITEGQTAEAFITVEFASSSRFGEVNIYAQLEDPSIVPQGAKLTLTDSQGKERTEEIEFGVDGSSSQTLYKLPVGEYTVRVSGCDIYGYKATVTVPSTIDIINGSSNDLNISIAYESIGTGSLSYHFEFESPSLGGELPEDQLALLKNSLSVTATDAFGRETVLEKDEGSSDFNYYADALPSGTYSIRIDGYDLAGHESRFSRCDTNITVVSGQHTGGVANICYFTRESTFSTKVCFAEGSVLNETNFPEGIEFWIYGEAVTEPVFGTLDPQNGWSVLLDSLPNSERISFELKSPAMDGYMLHSADVAVNYENATPWRQTHSDTLPFKLKHIVQFYDKGSYEAVITLDIQNKPEIDEPVNFRFELLPTLPAGKGLDLIPEDISIRLKSKDSAAEYTADFQRSYAGEAPFAASVTAPEGWYYISLENYEIEGFTAKANGHMGEIYLDTTPSHTKQVELAYGYGNGTVTMKLAFAEGSALNEDNFPGSASITFRPYADSPCADAFSAENDWSISYENLFNAGNPDDSDATPNKWAFSLDKIQGYGLRDIQVLETGENFARNSLSVNEDSYSASGSVDLWQNGTYELTFVLDFAKEDGILILKHAFTEDSELQAEDFPDGLKINVYYPGNTPSPSLDSFDESWDNPPDCTVTLGPDNDWTHTFTGMSYGTYMFEIGEECIPEFYSHYVRGNDFGALHFADVSGPDPRISTFQSYFRSGDAGTIQVNVSFAPGSWLNKQNFDGSLSLTVGDEEFILNQANDFRQAKTFHSNRGYIISQLNGHHMDGYMLTSELYNGYAYTEDNSIFVHRGEINTLDIVLRYEAIGNNKLTVSESFYRETNALALQSSAIKVYLTDLQGNTLQKGILNEQNCWSYVFDIPETEGDYIVRQMHDVADNVAVYSDYNEKRIHLTPGESNHIDFMSDYRMTITGPIQHFDFSADSALDWRAFPYGYDIELTDTTGRFTVTAHIHDGAGKWDDGILTIPVGTYESFTLLNADRDGYHRTTEFWYGYRIIGTSLRSSDAEEIMLRGPMTLSSGNSWLFFIRNHYTRFGSLTVTNEETFAYFGGSQLPGSLNSGLESQSYTYEVALNGEKETFTLKPGEEKTFSYLPNGTEYCVNVIAADGIAWNTPVSIDEGQIEGVGNEDATYNYTVHKLHDYLYLLDDDGVSAHFVKTDRSGNPLSGAKFGIYSDEDCTELVEYVSSGRNGIVTLRFDEVGTWYIKEVKAPRGYQLSDKVITAEVSHGWATQTRTDASGESVIVITETLDVDIDGLTAKDGVNRFENVPSSGGSGSSMTPATGDPFDPVYCVFLFMLSAALILLMHKRRKHA